MPRPSRPRELAEYCGTFAVWALLCLLPPRPRWRFAGWTGRRVGPRLWFAARAEAALRDRMPELSDADRAAVIAEMMENFSRLLVEYESLPRFYQDVGSWRVEGAEHLRAAQAAANGRLVVVTAHFGHWEAVRAVSLAEGAPLALIYRAFNNRLLDAWFKRRIESTGQPAFHKGKTGARALYRHVTEGGGAMILVDQRAGGAPVLDFLGREAETSLAAAQLALRAGAPLLTARAVRQGEGFVVVFDPPVPEADAAEMMQTVNDRIADWVRTDPGQWFWLHRRWKVRRGDRTRKGSAARPADARRPTLS